MQDAAPVMVLYRNSNHTHVQRITKWLRSFHFDVTCYDPRSPWIDPVSEVVKGMHHATFILVVDDGIADSSWLQAEVSYAHDIQVPLIRCAPLIDYEDLLHLCRDYMKTPTSNGQLGPGIMGETIRQTKQPGAISWLAVPALVIASGIFAVWMSHQWIVSGLGLFVGVLSVAVSAYIIELDKAETPDYFSDDPTAHETAKRIENSFAKIADIKHSALLCELNVRGKEREDITAFNAAVHLMLIGIASFAISIVAALVGLLRLFYDGIIGQ